MPHVDHYHNGKKLVSATELQALIAKPFLDRWKESLCNPAQCGFIAAREVAEEAAGLGNQVHEEVALYLAEQIEVYKEPWSAKIITKLKEMNVQKYLIEPESTLKDNESGLAGSPDAVVIVDGRPAISDIKIKNQLDPLTGMQGAAYRYLIKRKHNVDIRDMLILWAQKKSKNLTVKPVWIDLNEWTEPWKHLVGVWNVCNPSRKVTLHD